MTSGEIVLDVILTSSALGVRSPHGLYACMYLCIYVCIHKQLLSKWILIWQDVVLIYGKYILALELLYRLECGARGQ